MADELTPSELRILLAVGDRGGFTATAHALGMTQSSAVRAVHATLSETALI